MPARGCLPKFSRWPVSPNNVRGEQDIFCAALERTSQTSRAAFLAQACADDSVSRQRIEELLRAADAAGEFLSDTAAPVHETTGSQIDRYRLGERIGEGGFGVVYAAEQQRPVRRTVALKIIKLGMDTRAVVARFEAERQALALMEHPNIARVFDGGATATGRPYFVMELVRGVPITTFCNEQRFRLNERLELFVQVCRAVQHAHQKGIIHRDLKPSNILITREDSRAIAKVIDFGIAKATREPLTPDAQVTQHQVFMGTPAYMSPEQVGLGQGDVDTRSDIYSLGALLYELITDSPALDAPTLLAGGYADVQRAVQQSDPRPPSHRIAALDADEKARVAAHRRAPPGRLHLELRGDLDRIVLKALEKDRSRRYQTTGDLAEDILRHLRHEPVLAQLPTLRYRASKFVRRHRRGVVAGAVAFSLTTGFALYHTHRLAAERDRAQLEAHKAVKVSELLTELLVAGDPYRSPSPHGVLEASAASVRQEFAQQPEVRAEILNAVGRVYLRRGDYAKAGPVLEEALAAGRAIGRPDTRLAQALCNLGVMRKEIGDAKGAVPLLAESLVLRRQLLQNNHNDVAVSLVELGRAQTALERFDLAEPLFREALTMRRRVLGEEHREVAVSLGDLALLLWQTGELTEAEELFRQSLAMHRRTLGPDHPNVAASLVNFAQLRIDQNELADAEALLRAALPSVQRTFGEKHWRVARIMGHLATVWRRQGRLDEAATTLDSALAMAKAALGAERPLIAALALERAQVHLDRDEPAAAEPLLREALRVHRLSYGEDGWRVASNKCLLGAALLRLGRPAEAETYLRAATQNLKDLPGPQGRQTAFAREQLALLERSRLQP